MLGESQAKSAYGGLDEMASPMTKKHERTPSINSATSDTRLSSSGDDVNAGVQGIVGELGKRNPAFARQFTIKNDLSEEAKIQRSGTLIENKIKEKEEKARQQRSHNMLMKHLF